MPAVLVSTALLVLGACGSSSKGAKSTSTTTAKTATAPVALTGTVTNKGTKDLAGATTVSVEADDYYFQPTFVKATPGATLTVHLKNEGKAAHTFTIDGVADQMLNPDQQATVQVKVPTSGALNFYCRFHRAMGMQGAIYTAPGQSVTAAAATGASGATTAPQSQSTPSTSPATSAPSTSGSSGGSSGYGY